MSGIFHALTLTFQPSICPKCISKCLWRHQLISHETHRKIYQCCTKLWLMCFRWHHMTLCWGSVLDFYWFYFKRNWATMLVLWLLCWRLNEPSCDWLPKHISSVLILIWFRCITRNISWLLFLCFSPNWWNVSWWWGCHTRMSPAEGAVFHKVWWNSRLVRNVCSLKKNTQRFSLNHTKHLSENSLKVAGKTDWNQ